MYSVYAVDDDALILDEVMQCIPWLESGFEMTGGSCSPFEAEEQILQLRPNAVICDLKMPGMDGMELFSRLRGQKVESAFVMLSAFGTFEDSRLFFLNGGFDYLLKPLNIHEVQMVFERLARSLADESPLAYTPTGVSGFDKLVVYVAEHYTEKFTLERLGRQFHLSPNYICNLFARHYNSTFVTFLTDIRMKKAADIIQSTDTPLKEVAAACGYGNYFYFCKQFKAFYGSSPSLWREHIE